MIAYLSTTSKVLHNTAASSLTSCGLLPVFSNCRMTPTTISSPIPSISILGSDDPRGEGGGVCSCATAVLLDDLVLVFNDNGGAALLCDRLTRLDGGASALVAGVVDCDDRFATDARDD